MEELFGDGSIGSVRMTTGPPRAIQLVGEFDCSNSTAVEAVFDTAVTYGDDVVVDLASVTFASSMLIGLLLRLRSDLGTLGARVAVAARSSSVQRLLDVTGTDDLFVRSE